MEKKLKLVVALAVLGAVGYFVYIQARWGLFCMQIRETVDKVGQAPGPDAVLGIPDLIKKDAVRYHIAPEELKFEIEVEARKYGGTDMPLYYVNVRTLFGTKSYKYTEHKIESSAVLLAPENKKRMEDGGVKFVGN